MKRLHTPLSTFMASAAALVLGAATAFAGNTKAPQQAMNGKADMKTATPYDDAKSMANKAERTYAASADRKAHKGVSSAFRTADIDNDGTISLEEYSEFYRSTASARDVDTYTYDVSEKHMTNAQSWFAAVDADDNRVLSRKEFAALPGTIDASDKKADAKKTADADTKRQRDFNLSPQYYTVTYYTTITRMDTDDLEGETLVNLKGEEIGTIENIIQPKGQDDLYAMIDLDGSPIYRPGKMERDQVGVKLSNILFFEEGDDLVLTSAGETELRDMEANVIEEWDDVDSFYSVGR